MIVCERERCDLVRNGRPIFRDTEHLGMGPIRFLILRRMHLVRRALLRADPSASSVTRIVTDHGFWELGRFSVAYRALFGESPSETLRRPWSGLPSTPIVRCPLQSRARARLNACAALKPAGRS